MGLFSSKSKSSSSTNTTSTDNSVNTSGTIGDLSKNNIIAGGDVITNGLSEDNLKIVLDNNLSFMKDTIGNIKTTIGDAMSQVSDAYAGANDSILQSNSETKTLLRGLQPFALYAAAAVAVWAVFSKKR